MADSYTLEYKKNSGYRPVLDSNGNYKIFKTIAQARKYAVSMFKDNYYELIAVQGGGKFLGYDKASGKPIYEGKTAGIVRCEWSNGNRYYTYDNYNNLHRSVLNRDGTLGRRI